MKPAGIERDKQIAGLRGTLCSHPYMHEIGCQVKAPSSEICEDKCGCLFYQVKPYSTDISAAMELWEEIPQNSQMMKNPDGVTVIVYTNWQIHKRLKYKGEDTADAISGAWLKWKEGI